jgi:hypothetical protein
LFYPGGGQKARPIGFSPGLLRERCSKAASEAAQIAWQESLGMVALKQWIWFIGAAAWYLDAAVFMHYGARSHALLALLVATMFFVAGMVWVKNPRRH